MIPKSVSTKQVLTQAFRVLQKLWSFSKVEREEPHDPTAHFPCTRMISFMNFLLTVTSVLVKPGARIRFPEDKFRYLTHETDLHMPLNEK